MPVNILTSYETLRQFNEEYYFGSSNFGDNVCETYTRLAQGSDPKIIEAKFPDFIDRYLPPFTNDNGDEVRVSSFTNINLKKVTDIHLTSHTLNEIIAGGDIKYVRIFSLVAILVLLIACSNFINLATAQGLKRAKEIIVRRLNGSNRSNLIWQFILEYIPLVLISLVLAVLIVKCISPYYCNFIGIPSNYKIPLIQKIIFYSSVFMFTFIVAILYPAISISSKKLFARFKNNSAASTLALVSNKKSVIRKGLVIFQFSISIVIMICFGMISRQMKFIRNTNLGYNKENVVIIPTTQIVNEHWNEFKEKLKKHSGIKEVTITKFIPTDRLIDRPGLEVEVNGEWRENVFGIARNCVDHDYHKTFDMKIIAGRDFDIRISSDTTEAAILNERAVKQLGFENPEQAIGSLARWDFNSNRKGKIIGVVEDVHFESLHNEIPAMIHYMSSDVHNIAIRLVPGNLSATINYIEETWENYHHGYPMQFSFLDEKVGAQYKSEKQMMILFKYFGLLAVLIACLGLYGLARFSTETRVKEIGIRKTNGATQNSIVTLLSVDFAKNVLLAFIIASPVAWFFINKWLSNFTFKTNISWMVFLLSGLIALLTALLTVGGQSLKIARKNPVEALRYE
jgi:putative ABC transport system permease protein